MKETVEKMLPLERDLFFTLNGSDSFFLDNMMWTITGRFIWMPVFLFILFMFFYKTPRKEALLVMLFFILLFVACDQVSSSVFKPFFERLRPTHHPDFRNVVDVVNGYRGGRYGFVSGHATNSFGVAIFLSLLYKSRWIAIAALVWASLNSYSRIYLGVHFVSDIVAGMLVGTVVAVLLYELYIWTRYRIYHISPVDRRMPIYSPEQGSLLSVFIVVYLTVIIFFSEHLATLPH